MKKPEDQIQNTEQNTEQNTGQDTTQVSLGRRSFLAMGAGAAAAFSLPNLSSLSKGRAGIAATDPALTSPCLNGLVCGATGFPQPYSSPNNLGTPSNLIELDLLPQYGTVNNSSAEIASNVVFRSYNLRGEDPLVREDGASLTPGEQYFKLGPTFTFEASNEDQNTLNLRFINQLPSDDEYVPALNEAGQYTGAEPPSPNTGQKGSPGRPKGFSAANLHFHGLHVSPSSYNEDDQVICGLESRDAVKSSDDMLFFMEPGLNSERIGQKGYRRSDDGYPSHPYEVVLPTFHAPGTHWYHAHNDGSTGLHVVDGTAGALLVKDEGDAVIPVDEDLLWIVQELEGTTLVSNLQVDKGGTKKDVPTDQLVYDCANAPPNYGFTVNGVFQPSMTMKVNELHRWRFLAGTATPRGFMRITLFKIPDTASSGCTYQYTPASGVNPPEGCTLNDDGTSYTCPCTVPNSAPDPNDPTYSLNLNAFLSSLTPTNMNLMAIDGISFYGDPPQSVPWWDMSPANRADLFVQLSEPGNYWVVKQGFTTKGNFGGGNPGGGPGGTQVLGTITVADDVARKKSIPAIIPGEFPTYLQSITDDQLLKNADGSNYVRPVVFAIAEEATGVGCKDYKGNIKNAMPTSRMFVVNDLPYSGDSNDGGPRYTAPLKSDVPIGDQTKPGQSGNKFTAYQPGTFSDPDTTMPETVQIVHLNTCEEWIIYNYSNLVHPFHIHVNPFLLIESHDPNGTTNQDGINRWWDTIGIPAAKFNGTDLQEPGYVRIRSRFWDYWGEYVFHCHILVHEDQGMMQNVYVANDTTNPGYGPFEQVTESLDPNISVGKKIGDPGLPAGCYPQSYPAFQPLVGNQPQYPQQKTTDCLGENGKTCDPPIATSPATPLPAPIPDQG